MASRRKPRARPDERPNPNFEPNWSEVVDDFENMGLREEICHGIYSYGFKFPSEIQQLAIKPICDRRNVIAQAQSGTGKTGAFGIGVLQVVDERYDDIQAVILSPTRELAQQTCDFLTEIGHFINGLKVELFTGGRNAQQDAERVKAKPHIVVGTPGRIIDLLEQGAMSLDRLTVMCLDEADHMLGEGFLEQIEKFVGFVPADVQVLLFSATIPLSAFNVMEKFNLRDPVKILVKAEEVTLDGISQYFVRVEDKDKVAAIVDLFGQLPIQKAVVFANERDVVDHVQKRLSDNKFPVSAIHSGLRQRDREMTMKQFRLGHTRVLIGTDLIARGIDVQQVTLVINFQFPDKKEQYIHRIGRSGRMGRKGIAINLVNSQEYKDMGFVQRHYRTEIRVLPDDPGRLLDEVNKANERDE